MALKTNTIMNLINSNPELEYVINYYHKYPRNACLRRFLRKMVKRRKGKRLITLSFLGGIADLMPGR